MIFVTVGTQLPFDRMIIEVDNFAKQTEQIIFGQIGNGKYIPQNFDYKRNLNIEEYDKVFNEASMIISHAGMGTIITALTQSKPIFLMPRKASLGEHRNEHQLATMRQFVSYKGCYSFDDSNSLHTLVTTQQKGKSEQLETFAPQKMIDNLKGLLR